MRSDLSPELATKLRELGDALDVDRPVSVFRYGRIDVEEAESEREGQSGPAADAWQRTEARQGPAVASRTIGRSDLETEYLKGIASLREEYPEGIICRDPEGLWVTANSYPLGRTGPAAQFAIAMPHRRGFGPRAWAFWLGGQRSWIGPRHTNYPDGAVCAFPPHTVWCEGDHPRLLLDFYSQWALRQIYYLELDRWPGPQADLGPYYRLHEFKRGELCSCGSGRTYFECHRPFNLLENQALIEHDFLKQTNGMAIGTQRPPGQVVKFIRGQRRQPPKIAEVHPDFARLS